jgi:hypothetical protein
MCTRRCPAATELERAWSRQAVRFIEQAAKHEARMTAEERRTLLDLEPCAEATLVWARPLVVPVEREVSESQLTPGPACGMAPDGWAMVASI